MKVTGYKLREALRKRQLERETAATQFPESLLVFAHQKKASPFELARRVEVAEMAIAALQTAQTEYNLKVRVAMATERLTLLEAIKRVGALGRVEKLWKLAAVGKKDKYARYRSDAPDRIKSDEVFADRAVSPEEAVTALGIIAQTIGVLREAIAIGNACEVELESLDGSLFE